MKSFQIKFPRRVRIHGGECGAVARALHHEAHEGALTQFEQSLISDEKAFMRQAGSKKAFGSTLNERKQMSTKTSIKRIALVAVSALGFGLLSVVPASAAPAEYTLTRAATTPAIPVVGTEVVVPLTAAIAASDAITVATFTATFVAVPANSSRVSTDLLASTADTSATFATGGATITAATNVLTSTTTATSSAITAANIGSFRFTPDVPGRYSITITPAAGTGTPTFATNLNTQLAKVTAMIVMVTGAQITQSASGKGSTAGSAVIGGSAAVAFTPRVTTAANAIFNITSTGVGSVLNPAACASESTRVTTSVTSCAADTPATGSAVATINGTNYLDGIKYTSPTAVVIGTGELTGAAANGQVTFNAASSTAGTQTITITEISAATGVPTTRATVTITWVASASSAANAQYSTAYINAGTTLASSSNDDTVAGVNCSRTAGTQCANILVTIKDANNIALNQAGLTATITGPGILGLAVDGTTPTQAATGRAVATSAASQLAANAGVISVWPDGTSGTATITISSGTVTLATKTVNFYGTVATLSATQNLKVARASAAGAALGCSVAGCTWLTTATTPAVYIVAKDSAGQTVPGLTISMVSNNTNVIVSGAATEDDATAGDGPGYYNASVTSAPGGTSGASGTVVFRTLLSTGAYISTDALTFTLGGSLASMTLSLDKASYQVGEAMVVTRTAKDSAGNPVYDGVASPAVVFSKAIGGTAPAAGEFRSGVSASSSSRPTVFAPSTGGAFEARATYAVAATGALVQVTAKGSVSDDASTAAANAASDAAAEAIDAANAATDAANLAAEAADAATVAAEEARDAADAATAAVEKLASDVATLMAALKAQITTLANTVAKIAKKVKA